MPTHQISSKALAIHAINVPGLFDRPKRICRLYFTPPLPGRCTPFKVGAPKNAVVRDRTILRLVVEDEYQRRVSIGELVRSGGSDGAYHRDRDPPDIRLRREFSAHWIDAQRAAAGSAHGTVRALGLDRALRVARHGRPPHDHRARARAAQLGFSRENAAGAGACRHFAARAGPHAAQPRLLDAIRAAPPRSACRRHCGGSPRLTNRDRGALDCLCLIGSGRFKRMALEQALGKLQDLNFPTQIRESVWMFPTIETVHVFALVLVVGSIMTADLRLLGLTNKERPFSQVAAEMLPWTWTAFGVAALAGMLMFSSKALTYYANIPFRLKMVCLLLAGANMALFHWLGVRRLATWDHRQPPWSAKLAGGASL